MDDPKRSKGAKTLADKLSPQMSQTDLAKELGVSPQAVSNWVRGRGKPARETAFKIEQILGIPAEAWFEDENGAAA